MNHYPSTVVRPVTEQDLPAIVDLAMNAGPGMTNLPKDPNTLEQKIVVSLQSFVNGKNNSEFSRYLFVLEERASKKIIGCSGICAAGSHMLPFYHFKMSTVNYVNNDLKLNRSHKILTMVNDYQGCTEVCSLFLLPDYRKFHNGSLLSRCRFLFMAKFLTRFHKTIIAEMRGVVNDDGSQPFWDNVISEFINLPFLEADRLTGLGQKQFISDLMPRYPIYTTYLPKAARDVIDQVHKNTKPALELLKKEGFRSQGYVDIFDAGSMVECELTRINSVMYSKEKKISHVANQLNLANKKLYLISNDRLDFRSCIAELNADEEEDLTITQDLAEALNVQVNDMIRLVPFNFN